MLQKGDHVPHFTVTTLEDARVAYSGIWQRKHLLLVSLDAGEPSGPGSYVAQLVSRMPAVAAHEAAGVVTREAVPGVPRPGILIADRWGEIQAVIPRGASEGPDPDELVDWMSYVQSRCPECEGEAH